MEGWVDLGDLLHTKMLLDYLDVVYTALKDKKLHLIKLGRMLDI